MAPFRVVEPVLGPFFDFVNSRHFQEVFEKSE
jgi:hypothetical protein